MMIVNADRFSHLTSSNMLFSHAEFNKDDSSDHSDTIKTIDKIDEIDEIEKSKKFEGFRM